MGTLTLRNIYYKKTILPHGGDKENLLDKSIFTIQYVLDHASQRNILGKGTLSVPKVMLIIKDCKQWFKWLIWFNSLDGAIIM